MDILNDKKFPANEYEKLLKAVDGNLNTLVKDDVFIIPNTLNKTFINFLEAMLLLSRKYENVFWEDCKAKENENLFWETMKNVVEQNNIPYEEMKEVRSLTGDKYAKCVKDVFEKYIIYNNDDVKKNEWLKEQDVISCVKLVNFCINIIIVKRYNLHGFKHFAKIMFDLSDEKTEFLWNMIIENKDELRTNYIISKLDELTTAMGDNE